MRKLAIPQTYQPGSADEASELRVIAVRPTGSRQTASLALFRDDPDCTNGFLRLEWAQPELKAVLTDLIDALDGLAYRHPDHGLLALAGEPLWRHLPLVYPDTEEGDEPDLEAVAEWLYRLGQDAAYWWGGLVVTSNQVSWDLGQDRPVRTVLDQASACRISRGGAITDITGLILDRLPDTLARQLRSAMAGIEAVDELEHPLLAEEVGRMLEMMKSEQELKEQHGRLQPPPASDRPRLAMAIGHVLDPATPEDPDELTGDVADENAYVQSLILLEPIGNADQALDACLPPGSDGRILLDQAAQTAPELHALALRIADHLDGLACTDSSGNIPMAGILLHVAVSELLHYPHGDPLDRAAALYGGLWQAVGYHLVNVTITTPAGIWTSSTPQPLRAVLAGQTRCTIARPEESEGSGHACLDLPISDTLRTRWRSQP